MRFSNWFPRQQPLKACGAIFVHEQKKLFSDWLLNTDEQRLDGLSGVYTDHCIVVLGEEDILPWWPDSTYLGRDDKALNLYIPTYLEPPCAIELIEKSILHQHGDALYAIEITRQWIIPLSAARPLHKETILTVLS